jgi:hypothetical protein
MAKYSYFYIARHHHSFLSLHKLTAEVFIAVAIVFILSRFISLTFKVFCAHVQCKLQ